MAEESPRRFKVLGVLIQVPDRAEMPRLVRRQMRAKTAPNNLGDLLGEGPLRLCTACLRNKQRPIWVSIEPRHDVTPVPTQTLGCIIRDLGDQILKFRLGVPRRDVEQQSALGAVRLTKIPLPGERSQI